VKTVPAALVNCGTLVMGVYILRRDGTQLGWTQHDRDATVTIEIDGVDTDVDLFANPGFNIQSLVSTAGLGVDNTENRIIAGDDMTRADIYARLWDGSRVYFFRYSWKDPAAGIIPVKRGSFGNYRPKLAEFVVEFRDLRQALQSNSTWVFQEGCRWRLGDARCAKDLTAFTFTPITVTAVASAYSFTASALTQAADFFGNGEITWVTGLNAATPGHQVKTHATGGVITLSEFAVFAIQVGDTFTIKAGCRQRWDVDCRDKFDNLLNYGGEKDKTTRDELVKPAEFAEV